MNESLSDTISKTKLDLTEEIKELPVVIKVNGVRFGTLGNFSAIVGKAKARKTYFVSTLVAAWLSGESLEGTITCSMPKDKLRVLYFDTEQSKPDTQKVAKRIMQMANVAIASDQIEFYSLRSVNTKNRQQFISEMIKQSENVGLVIIDGIRDLVSNINDPEQATNLSDDLLNWTGLYNIHLIVVLHLNKTNEELRGHVGTEILNKSEMIVTVKKESKNKLISTVSVNESRGWEFEPLSFAISENDHPFKTEIQRTNSKPGRKAKSPNDKNFEFHTEVLNSIFKKKKKYSATDLKSAIQNECDKRGEYFSEGIARNYVIYYESEGLIKGKKEGVSVIYRLVNRKQHKDHAEFEKGKKDKITK